MNVNLSNQLAEGYRRFARTAVVVKYVGKTLQIEPQNLIGLQMKEQIQAIRKQDISRHDV